MYACVYVWALSAYIAVNVSTNLQFMLVTIKVVAWNEYHCFATESTLSGLSNATAATRTIPTPGNQLEPF